jgi:hypothetical protein
MQRDESIESRGLQAALALRLPRLGRETTETRSTHGDGEHWRTADQKEGELSSAASCVRGQCITGRDGTGFPGARADIRAKCATRVLIDRHSVITEECASWPAGDEAQAKRCHSQIKRSTRRSGRFTETLPSLPDQGSAPRQCFLGRAGTVRIQSLAWEPAPDAMLPHGALSLTAEWGVTIGTLTPPNLKPKPPPPRWFLRRKTLCLGLRRDP